MSRLSDKIERKFIKSYDVNDYEILTDTGWSDIKKINKTVKYVVWKLKTDSFELLCADNHIVFDEDMNEIFVKDLKVNDKIQTENGIEKVLKICNLEFEDNMYDLEINDDNHRYFSNGILSHNSTSYTIFCLWYCLINKDKNILICANKYDTAKEILQRIQSAYEELPTWLKPGITEWNKASIKFDNGCKISAEATSGNSGRGTSINCLIVDEFAFLKQNCEEEFLQSVFPVVSSSKTSKIIIVSTPHGMGNEFYRIWNRATLELDKNDADENMRWTPVKVDWPDVPGRDEEWYKQQLESFNGNMARFSQEFGCSFLGSSQTLIDTNIIKKYKDNFIKTRMKGSDVQLHKDYSNTVIKIYHAPEKGHAYIIGADPSMGMESDYQAMSVWDITNAFRIKQVASFYENNVLPKVFAYILAKTGKLFNNAFVAMENNGCSQVTLDALWRDFEYDSIIHEGGNEKTNIGIHSMNSRKAEACLNFKLILEDELREVEISDGRLLSEMEKFERRSRLGKMPTYEAADGHDDYMMATIWAFYVLKFNILERYYDVRKAVKNKLGEEVPLYITPFIEVEEVESEDSFDIDKKLNSYSNEIENQLNSIRKDLNSNEIDDFIKENNLKAYNPYSVEEQDETNIKNDDDFGFDVF